MTDLAALLSRIERLEKVAEIHNEVQAGILKAGYRLLPGTTAERAMKQLDEAADLLKPEGERP